MVPYLDPTTRAIRQKIAGQAIGSDISSHLKIRYPVKATRILPHSGVVKLPENSLRGIVGAKYLHQPANSNVEQHSPLET